MDRDDTKERYILNKKIVHCYNFCRVWGFEKLASCEIQMFYHETVVILLSELYPKEIIQEKNNFV